MRYLGTLMTTLCLHLLATSSLAATPIPHEVIIANADEGIAASTSLGFCYGQQYTLDEVSRRYPALAPEAGVIAAEFARNTGKACEDLEGSIQAFFERMEPGSWTKYRSQMKQELAAKLKPQMDPGLATEQAAKNFLAEVRKRGQGEISATVAQLLIGASQKFRQYPGDQWKNWSVVWRQPASGKNEAFHLRVPVAFVEKQPAAQHMIRKWTQRAGTGAAHIMLSASHFPYEGGGTRSQAELEMSTSSPMDFARGIAEEMGGDTVEAKRVKFMNRPALLVTTKTTVANLTLTITMFQRQAFIPGNGGLIIIGCAAGADDPSTAKALLTQYTPACDLLFNSFGFD